jgi:putative solute:sodium symporter small subunit
MLLHRLRSWEPAKVSPNIRLRNAGRRRCGLLGPVLREACLPPLLGPVCTGQIAWGSGRIDELGYQILVRALDRSGRREATCSHTNLSCLFLIQINVLCGWAGISFGVVLVREENTMARLGGYQKPYWIIVLGAIIILLLISLTHL